uniref:Putative capsid protein n=1 Tax=viral metagenome TaxID=1070528 RepID=A0A6M3L1L1_9ZZZZ
MKEIKTAEELTQHLGEMSERQEATSETVTEVKTAFETYKEEKAQEIEQLRENIKSVTVAVKNAGDWRNSDKSDGVLYRAGKAVQLMVRAHQSKSFKDHAVDLEKLGGAVMSSGSEAEWNKGAQHLVQKAGLSSSPLTGDDATGSYHGSYLIDVAYASEVLRVAQDASAMMGLVRTIPMSGRDIYFPASPTALAITKVTNENTDKTETTVTFSQAHLEAETYAGWIALSEEILEDSLVPLAALIRDLFGEAWGLKFDELVLNNSSAPTGILVDTSANVYGMTEGFTSFKDLTIEDIDGTIGELTTRKKRQGAVFVMHETVWDQVSHFADADGRSTVVPWVGDQIPKRLRGYPVVTSDGCPDINDSAAATGFLCFGNLRHFLHGSRVGFEFRIFDQTQSTMEADQIFLRVRLRQAFVNGIPSAFAVLKTAAS